MQPPLQQLLLHMLASSLEGPITMSGQFSGVTAVMMACMLCGCRLE